MEGEALHHQRDVALHTAIHDLVGRLQSQLRSAAERYSRLERKHQAALENIEMLRRTAKEHELSHDVHEREVMRLRRTEVALQEDAADINNRIAAREATAREQMQWIAGRERELTHQEATLAQRTLSFETAAEVRQSKLDAEAAHVQRMTQHAQQLLDDASKASEASTSRRLEVERMRRGLEETTTLHSSELQHRHRLVNEAISEREAYVEQRLHACASLETRLRQWASDINTEVAGHARTREDDIQRRESALLVATKQVEVRERQLAESQRVMEAERQELLHILSAVEAGSTAAGDDGQRALQRLRRIRTVLHSSGGTPADTSTGSRPGGGGIDTLVTESAPRADGVVSLYSRVAAEVHSTEAPSAQAYYNSSTTSSAFAISRASSEGRRSPPFQDGPLVGNDPRLLRAEELRHRQPPASAFRLPGSSSTWTWSSDSSRYSGAPLSALPIARPASGDAASETASVSSSATPSAAPQYFQEKRQRLQRSPPERRVITSPLKLKESKGGYQDPLS
jgi:hypothetical protein